MTLSEERKFKNLISTATIAKQIRLHRGYDGPYLEQAIYKMLEKCGIKWKTQRGGKKYFNRANAWRVLNQNMFKLFQMAEQLREYYDYTIDDSDNTVGYSRDDMSNVSRELLANDGVFGADENELYSTNEGKKTINISEKQLSLFEIKKPLKVNISEEQYNRLFEGVDINYGGDKTINVRVNQDMTDKGNVSSYIDTRFFGTKGDIAYGDGTYKAGYGGSLLAQYKQLSNVIVLYKQLIRCVKNSRLDSVEQLIDNTDIEQNTKTKLKNLVFNANKTTNEKLDALNKHMISNQSRLNVIQGKYDRINAKIRGGVGRPKNIPNDTIMPRYNIGLVPGTNVKVIGIFEINNFNFSDAVKNGYMRANTDTEKIVGDVGTVDKLGKGKPGREKVNVTYDDNITPDIANNFSLSGIETDPFNVERNNGHYKQQFGYGDKNYTSVTQFMDKSIIAAAYALKKEGIKIDYILDAPSSSKFNHYYCTNLSNKLGVEYRTGFFQRNMLNVVLDEDGMRKHGLDDSMITKTKGNVKNIALAEITSYMNDAVKRFVNENYALLSTISQERSSREKVSVDLLCDLIRELSFYGLQQIKEENPKTTNLYMYLVCHFSKYKKAITHGKYNIEHITGELFKILKTRLSRKYQALLGEIDQITQTYEQQLLSNGMKLSSKKKFKITEIDPKARPYIKNAYIVADSEMAHNKDGILDKLRSSLQNKHFLIVDEDMDSGATLLLLINALKDKELECGNIVRQRGRPKKNYIQDSQITCLVNGIKTRGH